MAITNPPSIGTALEHFLSSKANPLPLEVQIGGLKFQGLSSDQLLPAGPIGKWNRPSRIYDSLSKRFTLPYIGDLKSFQ